MFNLIKKDWFKCLIVFNFLLIGVAYVLQTLSFGLTTFLLIVFVVLVYAYYIKKRNMVIPVIVMQFIFLLTSNIYVFLISKGFLTEGGLIYTILECFYLVVIIIAFLVSTKMFIKGK
ncbi:MAG: hypothetical protein JWM44_2562 [Bacilli bacterium]|nr:hypothetical protein [Bacilli bacterium]